MAHKRYTVTVLLNVYDLHPSNGCLWYFGFGLFHCGVQLKYEENTRRHSKEYSFLGNALSESTGVFHCEPRQTFGAKFRTSLNMGSLQISNHELSLILDKFRSNYLAKDYDILTKNCNHFCDEFVHELTSKHIASWINRMAAFGTCCHCCIPQTVYDTLCDIQTNLNSNLRSNNASRHRSKRKLSHSLSTSLSSWIYSNSYLGQSHRKTKKKIMNNAPQNEANVDSGSDHDLEEGHLPLGNTSGIASDYMNHQHSVSVIALNDNGKEPMPKVEPATESKLGMNPLKDNIEMRRCINGEKHKKYGLTLKLTAGDVGNAVTDDTTDANSNADSAASYHEMPKTPSDLKRSDSIDR